jgi:DNA repair protein SbcD/Mre11
MDRSVATSDVAVASPVVGTIDPVKILHTADWHVGRVIRGRSRADEHGSVLKEIATIAAGGEVDLVAVAGDIFDVVAPTAESERIVYQALLDLADIAPVVMVAGNHDNWRRLEAVAPLLELGRVHVVAKPTKPEEGGVVRIETASGTTVRVAMLPFVTQRGIVSAADLMGLEAYEQGALYAERLTAILGKLTEGITTDDVNLVVAHLMVAEGVLGGGERNAHTVFDYWVPAGAFDGALSYVALGHLHRPQRIPAAAPVWYAGSPLQLDFGETEDEKAVMLVEAEPGQPASVTKIPLQAGRRLQQLRGTLESLEPLAGTTGDAYLKIILEEPARAGLADQVRELFPEAVDVLLVAPADAGDTAPPEPKLGRPPHELFTKYLDEVNASDERVVALFDELLEEAL